MERYLRYYTLLLLASCVPELRFYCQTVDLYGLGRKIDPNRRPRTGVELPFGELGYKVGLAHPRVTLVNADSHL